jgi:hypothetical protein
LQLQLRASSKESYREGLIAREFDLHQSANGGSATMKYISGRSAMAGRQGVNPALERAAVMIRTISPSRASFGRCSACAVRSVSICGALDQTDLAEFERIARHAHFAPNEALFTAGQLAHSVHNLTSPVTGLRPSP